MKRPATVPCAFFDGPRPADPAWTPPYCPWDPCPSGRGLRPFRWRRHGSFRTLAAPEPVRRFRCLACGRTFSAKTFSGVYFAKRPDILARLAEALANGAGLRQAARGLPCARSTAVRAADRLGRLAALASALILEGFPVAGPVAYDDFVSFALVQQLEVALGTSVDPETALLLGLSAAPRLKGARWTPRQRARIPALRAALPAGLPGRAFREHVDDLLRRTPPGAVLELRSDDDPLFRANLARPRYAGRVRHRVFPAPPRRRAGPAYNRALGPANALHQFLRHSDAGHRRETIAFDRRVASLVARAALFQFWRDFVQRRREALTDGPTPAMAAGLLARPLSWDDLLARRVFRRDLRVLPPLARRVLARDFPTPTARDAPRLFPRHWLERA